MYWHAESTSVSPSVSLSLLVDMQLNGLKLSSGLGADVLYSTEVCINRRFSTFFSRGPTLSLIYLCGPHVK